MSRKRKAQPFPQEALDTHMKILIDAVSAVCAEHAAEHLRNDTMDDLVLAWGTMADLMASSGAVMVFKRPRKRKEDTECLH